MEVTRPVETTDAVVLVEPAPLVKDVVVGSVFVHPIVQEDNAEMTGVEEILVELAPQLNLVPMESVWELPLPLVETDNAETTEPVEVVEIVPPDNDAVEEFVSVTMVAMTETVELLSKKREPILESVPKDLVEPVLQDIRVAAVADVKSCHLVL